MWDLNGLVIHNLHGHTGHVKCCVFSEDGDLLATASLDNTAKVLEVYDCNLIHVIFSVYKMCCAEKVYF